MKRLFVSVMNIALPTVFLFLLRRTPVVPVARMVKTRVNVCKIVPGVPHRRFVFVPNVITAVDVNSRSKDFNDRWMSFLAIESLRTGRSIGDPEDLRLIDDVEEQRNRCVAQFPSSVQRYHSAINVVHFLLSLDRCRCVSRLPDTLLELMEACRNDKSDWEWWLSQWPELAKRFVFQFNLALQPRSIIVFGCIAKTTSDGDNSRQSLGVVLWSPADHLSLSSSIRRVEDPQNPLPEHRHTTTTNTRTSRRSILTARRQSGTVVESEHALRTRRISDSRSVLLRSFPSLSRRKDDGWRAAISTAMPMFTAKRHGGGRGDIVQFSLIDAWGRNSCSRCSSTGERSSALHRTNSKEQRQSDETKNCRDNRQGEHTDEIGPSVDVTKGDDVLCFLTVHCNSDDRWERRISSRFSASNRIDDGSNHASSRRIHLQGRFVRSARTSMLYHRRR